MSAPAQPVSQSNKYLLAGKSPEERTNERTNERTSARKPKAAFKGLGYFFLSLSRPGNEKLSPLLLLPSFLARLPTLDFKKNN